MARLPKVLQKRYSKPSVFDLGAQNDEVVSIQYNHSIGIDIFVNCNWVDIRW
jgi:hypothetical protein